jgi:hypothetical protein
VVEVALAGKLPSATEAWDAGNRLGQAFEAAGWREVQVRVNDNRHAMIRYSGTDGVLRISVHWRIVAQIDDLLALVRDGSRPAWGRLRAQLDGEAPSRAPVLDPLGQVHDLEALGRAEQVWLPHPVEAAIGWGRWPARAPSHVLRLGSSQSGPRPNIAIHPVLDHLDVPGWFVGFVVFHELLHVVHPPEDGVGRRRVHTDAFARTERTHPEFHRANAWEVANVPRLMARMRDRALP